MPANKQYNETNRIVDQHLQYFTTWAHRYGCESARGEAMAQLAAIVLWFDKQYGTRRTYEVFQDIADKLVAPNLPPAADPRPRSQPRP